MLQGELCYADAMQEEEGATQTRQTVCPLPHDGFEGAVKFVWASNRYRLHGNTQRACTILSFHEPLVLAGVFRAPQHGDA
jgi:hypothetical protein